MADYRNQIAQERAIEIYKWARTHAELSAEMSSDELPNDGLFQTDSIPNWKISALDIQAMRMLTIRDLIIVVDDTWPRTFQLGRETDPVSCLESSATVDLMSGITRYFVPIGIARTLGGSSNLIQHKINPKTSNKSKAKARK